MPVQYIYPDNMMYYVDVSGTSYTEKFMHLQSYNTTNPGLAAYSVYNENGYSVYGLPQLSVNSINGGINLSGTKYLKYIPKENEYPLYSNTGIDLSYSGFLQVVPKYIKKRYVFGDSYERGRDLVCSINMEYPRRDTNYTFNNHNENILYSHYDSGIISVNGLQVGSFTPDYYRLEWDLTNTIPASAMIAGGGRSRLGLRLNSSHLAEITSYHNTADIYERTSGDYLNLDSSGINPSHYLFEIEYYGCSGRTPYDRHNIFREVFNLRSGSPSPSNIPEFKLYNTEIIVSGTDDYEPFWSHVSLYTKHQPDQHSSGINLHTISILPTGTGIPLLTSGHGIINETYNMFLPCLQPSGTIDFNLLGGLHNKFFNATIWAEPYDENGDIVFALDGHELINDSVFMVTSGSLAKTMEYFIHGHADYDSSFDLYTVSTELDSDDITMTIRGGYSSDVPLLVKTHDWSTSNSGLDFYTLSTNNSGLYDTLTFSLSGDKIVNADLNLSISGHAEPIQSSSYINLFTKGRGEYGIADFDITLYNTIESQNNNFNLSIQNSGGTEGYIPCSGQINMYINRSSESITHTFPMSVLGPSGINNAVDLYLNGLPNTREYIQFAVSGLEKNNNNLTFYVNGY